MTNILTHLMPLLWRAVLVGLVFLVVVVLVKLLLKKSNITSGEHKKLKVKNTLKGSGLTISNHPDGFIFGLKGNKKVYQSYKAEGHIGIFGGSGLGKTAALLIPTLRVWLGSFFCIDISGDISNNVECEKKCILAPDDPEHSMIYNVFDEIDKEKDPDEQREKLEQLVNLMVPLPPTARDAQEYFLRTARKIFLAGMLFYFDLGYDFVEICKTVFFATVTGLCHTILEGDNELCKGYVRSLAGEKEENVNGAKSTLNDCIKIFADNHKMAQILRRPNSKSEPYIAPEDLEEAQIFLVVPDKKQEYYSLFMNLVVSQMLDYISGRQYDRNKDKRILLALDEFASLRHLEILGPLRKFRKNGCNICLLTQSLADLDLVYGEKERKVILDNTAYTVVLSARDNDTKRYFSEMVGKEDAAKRSTTSSSHGGSTSTSYAEEYAIPLTEWSNLGDNLIVIHGTGYVRLNKNFYFK